MNLQKIIKGILEELEVVLLEIADDQYCAASRHLFNASIGQHVRHILEMYQCLLNGYDEGIINYDKRERNRKIETDRLYAVAVMHNIISDICRPSKNMFLAASFGSEDQIITIESNYERELVYNLEHTIHHMALIKVGIAELTDIVVSDKFGVAPSTIQHRAACAQ